MATEEITVSDKQIREFIAKWRSDRTNFGSFVDGVVVEITAKELGEGIAKGSKEWEQIKDFLNSKFNIALKEEIEAQQFQQYDIEVLKRSVTTADKVDDLVAGHNWTPAVKESKETYNEAASRKIAYNEFIKELLPMDFAPASIMSEQVYTDPGFRQMLNEAFDNAWREAKKIGAHLREKKDTPGEYEFNLEGFTSYVSNTYVPSRPEDEGFTFADYQKNLNRALEKTRVEKENQRKKDIEEAELAAIEAAKKAEAELEKNVKANAITALKAAGIDPADDPAGALSFANNLWKQYTEGRAIGEPIDTLARAKSLALRMASDLTLAGMTEAGAIPTPTLESIRLGAEAGIAELDEIGARRQLTDAEQARLRGYESNLAMVSPLAQARGTGIVVARLTAGQTVEMNTRMRELMEEEGMSQDQALSMAREEIYSKYGLEDRTVAKLDLSGMPAGAGAGGATSFENVSMAQRFGTGGGGGGNVNYSPSGKLQEVAGGGYVDMGKVSEIVSTYGLGGDPMLQEPGFLQFMIERDKALRAGWASEQEGLESAYARSLGRYGKVGPLQPKDQQGGIPAIPLTAEDIAAGLGAPGISGKDKQDVRGATMQQELTGQLGRFPTFGDYLKTVTRDQFTRGFEPKDITERTTKRVGRML